MRKRHFIFVALMLAVQCMMAQQVSQSEALQRARQFIGSSKQHKAKATSASAFDLAYVSQQEGKTHYYVFNNSALSERGGFVIVGGDETARTILGYSTSGTFDPDRVPENVRWWLAQYDQQISQAIKQSTSSPRKASHANWTTVPDLLTTKWDQGVPFNNALPSPTSAYSGNNGLATGCVATAMAQVMAYHQWPKKGTGSMSYKQQWKSNGIYHDYGDGNGYQLVMEGSEPSALRNKVITLTANFGNTTYDWDNMPDWYFTDETESTPTYNTTQANAVATLMYHCGVSVAMAYDVMEMGGSGASDMDIPTALIEYFGYDKSANCQMRDYYSDEEWEQKVYDELKAGRPLLYGGSSDNGGHEFVCHGYDADLDFFSFNWGWGGYCDGYYPLSGTEGALQPNGSGIGGAGEDDAYTEGQSAVFSVMPDQGGDYTVDLVCYDDYSMSKTSKVSGAITSYTVDRRTSSDTSLYLICSPVNMSSITVTFDLGVKFTGKKTGKVVYAPETYTLKNLAAGNYLTNKYVKFSTSTLEQADTYTMEPVFRLSGESEWQPIRYDATMTQPTLVIINKRDPADINEDGEVNISDVTALVNIILKKK